MRIINPRIVGYIQNALNEGHDINSIKSFLLKNKISQKDIDESITYLNQQNNTSEDKIKNYALTQIRKGYTKDSVRKWLLTNGYNSLNVDTALGGIKDHKSLRPIIIITSIALIIAIFLFVFVINKHSYQALNFSNNTPNNPAGGNNHIDTATTQPSSNNNNNNNGNNGANTNHPNSNTPSAASNFSQNDGSSLNAPPENNVDNNGNAINYNRQALQNLAYDTFGNAMSRIKETAKNNPQQASGDCEKFTSLDQRDICYFGIADSSSRYSFCNNIKNQDYRDNCYMNFALEGNTEVCDSIKNNATSEYCNQIRIVQEMQQAFAQNDTVKVAELNTEFKPPIYNSKIPLPVYSDIYNQTSTLNGIKYTPQSADTNNNEIILENISGNQENTTNDTNNNIN